MRRPSHLLLLSFLFSGFCWWICCMCCNFSDVVRQGQAGEGPRSPDLCSTSELCQCSPQSLSSTRSHVFSSCLFSSLQSASSTIPHPISTLLLGLGLSLLTQGPFQGILFLSTILFISKTNQHYSIVATLTYFGRILILAPPFSWMVTTACIHLFTHSVIQLFHMAF